MRQRRRIVSYTIAVVSLVLVGTVTIVIRRHTLPMGPYDLVKCTDNNGSYYSLAKTNFNVFGPEAFVHSRYKAENIVGIVAIVNRMPKNTWIITFISPPISRGTLLVEGLTSQEYNSLRKHLDELGRSDILMQGVDADVYP